MQISKEAKVGADLLQAAAGFCKEVDSPSEGFIRTVLENTVQSIINAVTIDLINQVEAAEKQRNKVIADLEVARASLRVKESEIEKLNGLNASIQAGGDEIIDELAEKDAEIERLRNLLYRGKNTDHDEYYITVEHQGFRRGMVVSRKLAQMSRQSLVDYVVTEILSSLKNITEKSDEAKRERGEE